MCKFLGGQGSHHQHPTQFWCCAVPVRVLTAVTKIMAYKDFNLDDLFKKVIDGRKNKSNKEFTEVIAVVDEGKLVEVQEAGSKAVLYAAYAVELSGEITELPIHQSQFAAIPAANREKIDGLGVKIKGLNWIAIPGLCFTCEALKGTSTASETISRTKAAVAKTRLVAVGSDDEAAAFKAWKAANSAL